MFQYSECVGKSIIIYTVCMFFLSCFSFQCFRKNIYNNNKLMYPLKSKAKLEYSFFSSCKQIKILHSVLTLILFHFGSEGTGMNFYIFSKVEISICNSSSVRLLWDFLEWILSTSHTPCAYRFGIYSGYFTDEIFIQKIKI